MRDKCEELEDKIKVQEQERLVQLEAKLKASKEENANLRLILKNKDEEIKANNESIE